MHSIDTSNKKNYLILMLLNEFIEAQAEAVCALTPVWRWNEHDFFFKNYVTRNKDRS